jgi:glycosyltransferase involved in cell wall biosynthesis
MRMRLSIAHKRALGGEERALMRASAIIANSQRTRDDLVRLLRIDPSLISVVYYGIDPDQFRQAAQHERDETRRELGLYPSRPLVLFVGALGDRRKGFDVVFDAWNTLSRSVRWQAQLLVIGRGADMLAWEDRVQHAGLAGGIRFLGFRDDVPRIMRAADLLVSPTRYESYGLGVHEALCCGLPAIVTASAGVAERYPVELHELLLPDPDDRADLTRRMQRVIDRLDQFRTAVSRLADTLRARTWDNMAGEIVELAFNRPGFEQPMEVQRT